MNKKDYTKEDSKKLYSLKLHEDYTVDGVSITRVPGGWIYMFGMGLIFIPFNNEFKENDELETFKCSYHCINSVCCLPGINKKCKNEPCIIHSNEFQKDVEVGGLRNNNPFHEFGCC